MGREGEAKPVRTYSQYGPGHSETAPRNVAGLSQPPRAELPNLSLPTDTQPSHRLSGNTPNTNPTQTLRGKNEKTLLDWQLEKDGLPDSI